MGKGYALHIGINRVKPAAYGGWDGALNACEADAEAMRDLVHDRGFSSVTLLSEAATRAAVVSHLKSYARTLRAGDLFVLSYSGHGGQLPDKNGDESDGLDETWCLYDGQWVDDQLYAALSAFRAGVRVLVLSDSCHSGTVARFVGEHPNVAKAARKSPNATPGEVTYRVMPVEHQREAYAALKDEYDRVLASKRLRESRAALTASVLLISGCQDNQLSGELPAQGIFTERLLRVWDKGNFARRRTPNYLTLHKEIVRGMPWTQTPNFFWAGAQNRVMEREVPFTP